MFYGPVKPIRVIAERVNIISLSENAFMWLQGKVPFLALATCPFQILAGTLNLHIPKMNEFDFDNSDDIILAS